MVKNRLLLKKDAFTMIELIFAIVIIAISVMTLPVMTQSTAKGIESNILQEAVFATEAILNESTSYYWDKYSLDDANVSDGYSRVVNTGDCIAGTPNKRLGHINRQCLNNNATAPFNNIDNKAIEWVGNIYNNLDILTGSASSATYKNSYSATATVTTCSAGAGCVQFGLEANNPNLKEIEIKVTPTGSPADTLVLLRAYSANIGEVKPESRIF